MVQKSLIIGIRIVGLILVASISNISAPAAQTVSTDVKLSISGGQSISQSFAASLGDNLSVSYTVDSSNESSCLAVNLEFKPSNPYQTATLSNLTSVLGPYSRRTNSTWARATGDGSLSVTYSACPEVPTCKGKISIDSTYSLSVSSLESAKQQAQNAGFYLAGMIVSALAATFFGIMLFFMAKKQESYSAPGNSPTHVFPGGR